jgi:hypothetical protein
MQTRRKRSKGGKAGSIKRIMPINNDSQIIGAGSYGLVLESFNPEHAIKLFYDLKACNDMKKEAEIQRQVRAILQQHVPEVKVPEIFYIDNAPTIYKHQSHLCGIAMERLLPPAGYSEMVHTALGYFGPDMNASWGRITSQPVDESNPTRGFFADANHLEDIWEAEGSSMTIEHLAYLIGKASRVLIDHGIMPIDVEYVWSKGSVYMIDFGLCKQKRINPQMYLEMGGVDGLLSDVYIPNTGDEGHESFLRGYLGSV